MKLSSYVSLFTLVLACGHLRAQTPAAQLRQRTGAEITGISLEGSSGTDHSATLTAIARLLRPSGPADVDDKWLREDVASIITEQEEAAFLRLTTQEEREKFMEQFWARRDLASGVEPSKSKSQHYRRIAYANERFARPGLTGWQTDRGRFYISLGPPDRIEAHPGQFEKWFYSNFDHSPDTLTLTFNLSDR